MSSSTVRARKILSDNFSAVLLVLLILACLGAVVSYQTHIDPGTETERIEESSWSSTAEYSHQALVRTETTVFSRGTVLQDRTAYLRSVAPILNGTFQYSYQATDGGELTAEIDQTLVLRAAGDDGEVEFWRDEIDLGSETVEQVAPSEQVRVPFSVNVTEMSLRIEAIEEQLGGSAGNTEILVETTMTLSGQRNGLSVAETENYQVGINNQNTVYRVEGDTAVTDSGQQFRDETVPATYGPLRTAVAPLLLGLSLVGLLGLAVGRTQHLFEVSDREREWLAYRSDANEFSEWLSTGTIPETALSRTTITVETLADLVDIAIDSNRRVVRDDSRDLCAVLLEETVYTFEPPDPPEVDEPLQLVATAIAGGEAESDGDEPGVGGDKDAAGGEKSEGGADEGKPAEEAKTDGGD